MGGDFSIYWPLRWIIFPLPLLHLPGCSNRDGTKVTLRFNALPVDESFSVARVSLLRREGYARNSRKFIHLVRFWILQSWLQNDFTNKALTSRWSNQTFYNTCKTSSCVLTLLSVLDFDDVINDYVGRKIAHWLQKNGDTRANMWNVAN